MNLPRLFASLLLLISAAQAEEGVNIRFRTVCFFPVGDFKTLSYQAKKANTAEVELPRLNLSPSYVYQGPAVMAFTPKGDAAKIVASATIPESMKQALLLFLPAGPGSPQPFRVLVLDDSSASLAGGDSLFFNFSQDEIAGMFGDKKLQIRPGQSVKMTAPTANDGRYQVDIRSKNGETWRPLCKSLWFHDPSTRQLVFIFEEPTTKRTRFMSLSNPMAEDPHLASEAR